MKKLWAHTSSIDSIEAFTAGDDPKFDLVLFPHDIHGSIAHVQGLKKIGILTSAESKKLIQGLVTLKKLWSAGKITIKPSDEDCHTVIENYLTKKYGALGKKIHTGRSRNDQVLTALRLYMKDRLSLALVEASNLVATFAKSEKRYSGYVMPGYTHMQRAMPSSVGLWFGAFKEALADDIQFLKSVATLVDQSPLGSVVGYGEKALGLDRQFTALKLGFAKVQKNPIYAANSRGKFELLALHALQPLVSDIGKFATDALLFSTKEFGFLSLPISLATGSSAMPQKKNYDVLELLRAQASRFAGSTHTLATLIDKLPSGYNRDLQLTKKIFIENIESAVTMLGVAKIVVSHLAFNKEALEKATSPELYATEEAYELVKKKGVPFRDAYHEVAKKYRV